VQEELMGAAARALAAAAFTSLAPTAFAISLGEIEVRSALGEVLDARVPISLGAGEAVDANCFALARDPEPGVPLLAEGLLTVERVGARTELRIRSTGSVFEPAMRVRLRAACPGQAGETLRQYSVLLDPRRGDPVAPSVPTITASLDARSGDTLAGLASKVFPRNNTARDRYLQAMREVNPALASLGDSDPIPAGANVALPDLRTFGRDARAQIAASEARQRRARPTAPEASPRHTARAERAKPRRSAHTTSHEAATPAASTPAPTSPAGDVVLRLSGGNVDLSRTREVDDRTRAQLRERLLILESDDQVAAVLALRNRLAQLEQRVNELQLKLAQMPASFPAPRTEAPAATPVEPAKAAVAPPPVPEPVKETAPATEPAKVAEAPSAITATTPAASKDDASTATAAQAATSTPPQSSATPPVPAKPAPVAPKPAPAPGFDLGSLWQTYGLWAAFIGVLSLLMLLVWRLTHRPEPEYDAEAWDQPAPTTEPGEFAIEAEPVDMGATLALEAPDAGALRRRYIEERFPEVVSGTLSLEDPASVVKGARLLYEDGSMPRAIELLQFAIEEHPGEVRPWLALFEIYRLERLTNEFAELARRFYEQHGNTEYWRKVRYFGREIDPGNFLYRDDVDALETIAPGNGRRDKGERFDPARENWLEAPMDFEDGVLANELRKALMSGAGVVDQDLVPNPMPALRDAEMFTVA
jgi:phage tail protein X